jgi:hypothetical protein
MQRTSCNMQPAAQVKPLSRRRCMPCRGHAMLATRTGAASTSTLVRHKSHVVQFKSYAAVYGMHAVRSRLHAVRMHACNLQRITCSMVACMLVARDLRCEHQRGCAGLRPLAVCREPSPSPSRSMFPLRARARRARGVPQRFRASKGCSLAEGAGPSVLGCRASCRVHAARRASTSDATRRRQRARAGRLRRTNYGGHSRRPPPARSLLIASLFHCSGVSHCCFF